MTRKKNSSSKNQKSQTPPKGSRFLPFALVGVALVAGVMLGGFSTDIPAEPAAAPAPTPQTGSGQPAVDSTTIARVKLDLDGAPTLGPDDAPVTVVEFIDYQCPFCSRGHKTVGEVRAKYGDSVQVAFLQNPLSFHKEAPLAAQAALAAAAQGRFGDMHELLLANQKTLQRANLVVFAEKIGLDIAEFEAAIDSGRYAKQIQNDQVIAARVGATATPYFFVNGREIRGAQPLPAFSKIIDEELAGNLKPTRWIARVPAPQSNRRAAEDPNKRYEVDIADSITLGPADARVTIVEFTDYQCSFCSRAQATVQQILAEYPDDVRLVVKNMPLGFHGQARPAAIAAMAADRQDKYWEYRALLFENFRTLNEGKFVVYAQQVGVDLAQWEADRKDPALAALVDRDVRQAGEVGVRGTPTFFVNGKKLVGAQPFTTFKAAIDASLNGKPPRQAAAR